MNPWVLPETASINGKEYAINADFRDILTVISYLDDSDEPEYVRWRQALAVFYEDEIPPCDRLEAMSYMALFINCGKEDENNKPSVRLIDWNHDAQMISADINKVACCEVRSLPFLHWWTFVAYFCAIGEGQLSTVVGIRDKLRRHRPLDKWEKDYYRENRDRVELPKKEDQTMRDLEKDWIAAVKTQ